MKFSELLDMQLKRWAMASCAFGVGHLIGRLIGYALGNKVIPFSFSGYILYCVAFMAVSTIVSYFRDMYFPQ